MDKGFLGIMLFDMVLYGLTCQNVTTNHLFVVNDKNNKKEQNIVNVLALRHLADSNIT